ACPLYQAQTGRDGGDRKVVTGGRRAAWKLERGDTSLPVESAITGKVFVRVPESAIVAWVDGHRTVVAPACLIPAGLRARAVDNRPLSLVHQPRCVARKPPREVNRRIESGAGPT